MGVWDGSQWHWDLKWRQNLFDWEVGLLEDLMRLIGEAGPNIGVRDRIKWLHDTKGVYSVKSFTGFAY